MAQICKLFIQDINEKEPVDVQIQSYLESYPGQSIAAVSYAATGISREALVVFSGYVSRFGGLDNKYKVNDKYIDKKGDKK